MILVTNCMVSMRFSDSFDRAILRAIKKAAPGLTISYQPSFDPGEPLSQYSRLIVSGSEVSVLAPPAWQPRLETIIRAFLDAGKPVLGICYGHQLLASVLAGKGCVRRSPSPEFGWTRVSLEANPLFSGIEDPVFMVSHYDEVIGLNDDFGVIAANSRCGVHAFQYQNRPVWGVQFHPEYLPREADEIFSHVAGRDPQYPEFVVDVPHDPNQLEQNRQIIANFCRSS